MNALTLNGYDGLDSLHFSAVATPKPGPRDVVLNVRAASLNPIDAKFAQGLLRDRFEVPFPHVLGRDCSGVVVAIGNEVTDFRLGGEVYAVADIKRWGTHATEVVVDAASVAFKPTNIDHIAAASLPIVGLSAIAGLVTAGASKKGDRVLIHAGAGGVGSFAIQLAKRLGAFVATTAGPANLEYVRGLGADVVVDYTKTRFEQELEGYDLVFDLVGGDTRYRSFNVLRPGGMIVHLSTPPMTQPAPRGDVTVKQAMVNYATRDLDQLSKFVGSGALHPAVSRVFPFGEAVKAYELMMSGHVRGKVVLEMPENR